MDNFSVPTGLNWRTTRFSYESLDNPIHDAKKSFKINFFKPILDTALQSINE